MRLKNSGSFCRGQVPRTSHVATRPKKHVRDASVPGCRGLLQQAPPQVCSCCRRCRADTRICSWTTCTVVFFFCFFLFFRLVLLKNILAGIVCCYVLLLCVLHFVLLHVSFTAKQIIISKGSGAAYYILKNKSGYATINVFIYVRISFWNRVGTTTLSSLRT